MQIIESSALGLRSARLQFINRTSNVTVTLFPMIHIGEPAFYETVYDDAFCHDVVLVEGVNSFVVRRITSSYRWVAKAGLGLIVQPSYRTAANLPARIVHADLSADEFRSAWRKVPFWLRVLVLICSPIFGLQQRFLSTRQSLARGKSMDDLASRDDILTWDPTIAKLEDCLIEVRDARLIEKLREELALQKNAQKKIAIVYGASHMRAVLAELHKQNFVSSDSRWLTIFTI